MTTNHQLNHRKKAINLLKRSWSKDGYEFKKIVRNTVTFRHKETGKKVRTELQY